MLTKSILSIEMKPIKRVLFWHQLTDLLLNKDIHSKWVLAKLLMPMPNIFFSFSAYHALPSIKEKGKQFICTAAGQQILFKSMNFIWTGCEFVRAKKVNVIVEIVIVCYRAVTKFKFRMNRTNKRRNCFCLDHENRTDIGKHGGHSIKLSS